jgi:acyl carrier protein
VVILHRESQIENSTLITRITMQANALAVRKHVAHLISATKGVKAGTLAQFSDFRKLGFDELDLVEVILEVEKAFGITIPDELPLNDIDDFVQFICRPALRQAS